MRTWTVPLVNPRGGTRRDVEVEADTAREAVEKARAQCSLQHKMLHPDWADENGLLDGVGR